MSFARWIAILLLWAPRQDNTPIPGIGPTGEIVKLHTGFKFTEGPAADALGNVYFVDIPNNRIHKSDLEGELSTFLENSEGCNGLMFDGKGRLIACQGKAGRMIAIDPTTRAITPLTEKYAEKAAPNDLVVDREGGVYFTDPDQKSVYYVPAGGKMSTILTGLARPNGVILSPDEKTLYVLLSGLPECRAFSVEGPGKVGAGKVFAQLIEGPRPGGDGMTVDTKGNLYLTKPSAKAIQVVTPEGRTLGVLKFPEEPANCTFGGKDMKTLFVTARTSLYTVRMEAAGHRFVGK